MRSSLVRILVIIGLAVGAGCMRAKRSNLRWVPDVKAIEAGKEKSAELRQTAGVMLERFLELIDEGAVVIDARPADAFEEGHLDIDSYPPVLNVPPEQVDEHLDRLMELLGLPVVLYCTSQTCDYAEELYVFLGEYGFTEIWIYFPGWDGIVEAGLATAAGPDTWTGFGAEPNAPPDEDYGAPGDDPMSEADTPDGAEP